ncbi:hypothetical protein [Algoriphagus sp. AK58]|uniref:hypothetical protein n=1 Tax=Algoriphagus sp. AK58 TaxID=1406877 RepID=UPI00164FB1AB|nr:hypothetical protein [Algoriphagus sp. AK58]MBC6365627.1 hypothetical protein [Algoriphagus sp. AK58]
MKYFIKIMLMVSLVTSFQQKAWSQMSYALNREAQEKLAFLSFLEGTWKGTGWMMGENRVKMTFEQEERVQFQLSGTLLQIEGIGRADGKTVHHALAMIQPAKEDGAFEFTSFLQSGLRGTYPARWENNQLIWQPTEQVRYVIQLNDQGQWYEVGEYQAGGTWYQFFEMTLDKVK